MDKIRYSVTECLAMLGVSRKTFYDRVRAGKYETITDGRRRFMTQEQLIAASKGDTNGKTPLAKNP